MISFLVVPCDKIFIKVLPTKCHDHVKNIFEVIPHCSFDLHFSNVDAGEGVEKREPSCTVGGNVN